MTQSWCMMHFKLNVLLYQQGNAIAKTLREGQGSSAIYFGSLICAVLHRPITIMPVHAAC